MWLGLVTLGGSLTDLRLTGDDSTVDDLGDGMRALGLIRDGHVVPKFIRVIDGYSGPPREIHSKLDVVGCDADDDFPTNILELPYDRRRDNRVPARRRQSVVDRKLAHRRSIGPADARVILLAHSMGGLVARYYLEVLARHSGSVAPNNGTRPGRVA